MCHLQVARASDLPQLLPPGCHLAVHGRAAGARPRARGWTLSPERRAAVEEIAAGLSGSQKQLPSKLFYDELGSELFEEITRLPEYYLARSEQALLDEHVPRWIAAHRPRSLVELGAGSAAKSRLILDAMGALGPGAEYLPVDISRDYLVRTAAALRAEYPDLSVEPVVADFTRSLPLPPTLARPALLTFLGSTIGNFTSPQAVELLRRVSAVMQPQDRLLLGLDLRKEVPVLEAAYNDSRGLTARFNLNLLRVVNRRFGADFDVEKFSHRAFYNRREHRVEMHLVSAAQQTVNVPDAGSYVIDAGETIRTEISCKYDRKSVDEMFAAAGLVLAEWQQDANGYFALSVAEAAAGAT